MKKRKYRLRQADALERKDELSQMVQEARFEFEDRKNRLQRLQAELELHTKSLNTLKQNRVGSSSRMWKSNKFFNS